MLDSRLTKILSGCLLGLWGTGFAYADDAVQVPATNAVQAQGAPSAADTAYQTQMLALSQAIAAKIAQIQSLQQQIDAEIYPASKPPLIAQQAQLQKDLADLNMRQQQLQAQKSAADISTSLQQQAKP